MPSHFPEATGPQVFLESRRGTVEQVDNAGAQYYKVYGFVDVVGIGEATVNVTFPVKFSKKPVFHFGSELAPGFRTTTGKLPTLVATILGWLQSSDESGNTTYSGADVCVVTTGDTTQGQVMTMHWSVEGIGIRNPVGTE